MKTFRTAQYMVRVGGFWDRLKDMEGQPEGGWSPQDMAQSHGGELQGDLGPVPPKPQQQPQTDPMGQPEPDEVAPWSADDMAGSYGGEPGGELGANPKPGMQQPGAGAKTPKRKAQYLHNALKEEKQKGGSDLDAISAVARDFTVILSDPQVARWFAKYIAKNLGEELEGHFYFRHEDDPLFMEEFEQMKATLPENVQQILDEITGRGDQNEQQQF